MRILMIIFLRQKYFWMRQLFLYPFIFFYSWPYSTKKLYLCFVIETQHIMGRFINPFTDFGFKFLFGREVEKELLIDFLNDLQTINKPNLFYPTVTIIHRRYKLLKKIRIVHPSRQHTQRMKIKPTQRMKKLPFLLSKTTMNYVISYGISCQRLTLFSKQQMEKKD